MWPKVGLIARWLRATAFERIGQLDSAAVYFELLAPLEIHRAEEPYVWNYAACSYAQQRLVVLYSRMGHLHDARRHWRAFSETFTHPDPELVPLVEEARAALAIAGRRT